MNAIQKTIEVINELYEKTGKKPIQAEVRRAMGGGSFSTISEAFRQWEETQDQTVETKPVLKLPEVLNKTIQTFAINFWAQSVSLSEEELAADREVLAKKAEKWQNDLKNYQSFIEDLEANIEADKQVKADLTKEKEDLTSALGNLQQQMKDTSTALEATITVFFRSFNSYFFPKNPSMIP